MNMMGDNDLSDLFEEQHEFADTNFGGPASPDDLFSIFEGLDAELTRLDDPQKQSISLVFHESETTELDFESVLASPISSKRPKLNSGLAPTDGQQRVSHITVERNRRRQMNEHLTVLRKLMPCFYVKRVSFFLSIRNSCLTYFTILEWHSPSHPSCGCSLRAVYP